MTPDQKAAFARTFPVHVGVDTGKRFHVLVARGPDGLRRKPVKVLVGREGFEHADAELLALFPDVERAKMLIGLEFAGHHGFTFAHFLASRGYAIVNVLPAHTKRTKELTLQHRDAKFPLMRMLAWLIVAALLVARPAAAQCPDPHYRWTEKTRESLASITPVKRSIGAILNWATLEFTSEHQYKCAPRKGHELQVYSVLGWVRRVKTDETDRDWHIELTARENSDTGFCVIAEIPPAELGGNYAQARTDLQNLVTWDSHGDVIPPVRLRFIGAAFFDGEHRGNATHRDQTDGGHGRGDSSARALWELHRCIGSEARESQPVTVISSAGTGARPAIRLVSVAARRLRPPLRAVHHLRWIEALPKRPLSGGASTNGSVDVVARQGLLD